MPDNPLLCAIEFTTAPDASLPAMLSEAILASNEMLLGPSDRRPLAFLLRSEDGGQVIGGLSGRTGFQWLFVEYLFVPQALRGQHLGRELLARAEEEAKRRGCLGAWLDTFSPVAYPFYLAQGYELFGEIRDYPPGNARRYLLKRFSRQIDITATDKK
jgi:GNAT superfamily N-acetyltransferase